MISIKNSNSNSNDIKKWFLDIKNSNSWYQEIEFLISRNRILDIKKSNSWYQEIEYSWYQKIFLDIKRYFLISRIHFLISRIHFLISRIYFLRSRIRILDIQKCWINSRTVPHRKVTCKYLHLHSIFPVKCVGGPSAFIRAWLHRYVNQHSATYIVLLSEHEVVDVKARTSYPMSISKVNDM